MLRRSCGRTRCFVIPHTTPPIPPVRPSPAIRLDAAASSRRLPCPPRSTGEQHHGNEAARRFRLQPRVEEASMHTRRAITSHQWANRVVTLDAVFARPSRNQNKIFIRFTEVDQAILAWKLSHSAVAEISPLGLQMLVTLSSGFLRYQLNKRPAFGIATDLHFVPQPDLSPIGIFQRPCTTITSRRWPQGLKRASPDSPGQSGYEKREQIRSSDVSPCADTARVND